MPFASSVFHVSLHWATGFVQGGMGGDVPANQPLPPRRRAKGSKGAISPGTLPDFPPRLHASPCARKSGPAGTTSTGPMSCSLCPVIPQSHYSATRRPSEATTPARANVLSTPESHHNPAWFPLHGTVHLDCCGCSEVTA